MTANFNSLRVDLKTETSWLVTGAAGFIGSHLVEYLLRNNQQVRGLDNFITGKKENFQDIKGRVSKEQWDRFDFIEGDIRDYNVCFKSCKNIDYVLHQAALGSVPRSIKTPSDSHTCNVDGTFNMFRAAYENKVKRLVYASSSSVYGDSPELPKHEERIGRVLSPYAATKRCAEVYAQSFSESYGISLIGLRYFNVFGRRQDENGPYAAVIPKWIRRILMNDKVEIYGDGETSRDFCYIDNSVYANILAATSQRNIASEVYNVSCGDKTSLNQLYTYIVESLSYFPGLAITPEKVHKDFRQGDIRHSLADISKISKDLDYRVLYRVKQGLEETIRWYIQQIKGNVL